MRKLLIVLLAGVVMAAISVPATAASPSSYTL